MFKDSSLNTEKLVESKPGEERIKNC